MLTITDLTGKEEALTDFKELTLNRKVNGEKSISLTVLPTRKNAHSFLMVEEESILTFDGEEYVIKKMNERSIGNTYIKRVDAVHKFYVDMINSQQPNIHNGSMTFANYLNFVFGGTGYTFSIIDTFYAQSFENLGNDNRLALLQKGLERYNAEMEIVGNNVRFKSKVGNDTDFQFRYGHNIKTIERNVDTTNLATVIRGTGTDGITTYYRSPNADIFGEIDSPPVNDERFTTEEALLEEMKSRIQDTPDFSITIDFVDLRAAGYPWTVPNEGDRVYVIYEPMNDLLIETRILEITEVYDANLNIIKTNVTLANYKKTFAGTMFDNVSKRLKDIVNDDGIIKYNVLHEAVRLATEALQSAQTELEFINGITGRDPGNPNLLTRLTSRGIGVSSDGGNTFPEAITGHGINTNLLTAGQIKTNNIQIIGRDNLFYWDGNALIALDEADPNKFTRLNSNGLYSAKGTFTAEREDGLKTIIGGKINQDFNIQGATPPFILNAEIQGRHFKTLQQSTSPSICQVFTFKKIARFLKFEMVLGVDNQEGNNCRVFIEPTGQNGVWLASATSSAYIPDGGESKIITIDLGVPDASVYAVYLRMFTTSSDTGAYSRVVRAYLTDFE